MLTKKLESNQYAEAEQVNLRELENQIHRLQANQENEILFKKHNSKLNHNFPNFPNYLRVVVKIL